MASSTLPLGTGDLSLSDLRQLGQPDTTIELSRVARAQVKDAHAYLQQRIGSGNEPLYGVNTGFGALQDTVIPPERIRALQLNMLRSHACGTGELVPPEIVRLMLALKVHSLARGYSGVRIELIDRLVAFHNQGVLPVVFSQGSLGASGDLAPLAHLCLPLIGEGEVFVNGERLPASVLAERFGWPPLELEPKEGLALINGTQLMSAYGAALVERMERLWDWANALAALSLEVYRCNHEPFAEPLQRIRRHAGQTAAAQAIRELRAGSGLAPMPESVQDPYAFRCVPQVQGAARDGLDFVHRTVFDELNSISDNPNIFVEEEQILAGGNFHGQAIANALDHLGLLMAQLGNIAERRVFKLLAGQRGLPPFLTQQPGEASGLMILQYTAAALVNELKHQAAPHAHDSIPSSDGQEDVVSMGANAALKRWAMLPNLERILAIEWLHAAQALDFRRPAHTTPPLERLHERLREVVPQATADQPWHWAIEATRHLLLSTEAPLPQRETLS